MKKFHSSGDKPCQKNKKNHKISPEFNPRHILNSRSEDLNRDFPLSAFEYEINKRLSLDVGEASLKIKEESSDAINFKSGLDPNFDPTMPETNCSKVYEIAKSSSSLLKHFRSERCRNYCTHTNLYESYHFNVRERLEETKKLLRTPEIEKKQEERRADNMSRRESALEIRKNAMESQKRVRQDRENPMEDQEAALENQKDALKGQEGACDQENPYQTSSDADETSLEGNKQRRRMCSLPVQITPTISEVDKNDHVMLSIESDDFLKDKSCQARRSAFSEVPNTRNTVIKGLPDLEFQQFTNAIDYKEKFESLVDKLSKVLMEVIDDNRKCT